MIVMIVSGMEPGEKNLCTEESRYSSPKFKNLLKTTFFSIFKIEKTIFGLGFL